MAFWMASGPGHCYSPFVEYAGCILETPDIVPYIPLYGYLPFRLLTFALIPGGAVAIGCRVADGTAVTQTIAAFFCSSYRFAVATAGTVGARGNCAWPQAEVPLRQVRYSRWQRIVLQQAGNCGGGLPPQTVAELQRYAAAAQHRYR
jgi:hypothetical protein